MKLKIINEFGNPLNLRNCDGITVKFPYMGDKILEKNAVSVLDMDQGIVDVKLSDFDIQGLNVGLGQNFKAEVKIGDTVLTVLFAKGLNVELNNDKKVIL